MRSWLLVDVDRINQDTYKRLSRSPEVFLHMGAFHVPVDGVLAQEGVARLVLDGIPRDAITVGGK
jgi:hypothetical protein